MKIGFEAKRLFHNATGLGNYSRDVVRILRDLRPGENYHAYTPRPGKPPPGLDGLIVHGPRTRWARAVPALWRTRGMVRDLLADRIDLFHGLSAELPLGIERTRVATVVTIHDLIFERAPQLYSPVDRRIYRAKARSAVNRARRVIAVTEETAGDLVRLYGVARELIRVVHPVVGSIFRRPPAPEALEEVKKRLGLPERFLLAVGTLERRKNLLVVLEALRGLSGVPLVAVGRPTAYLHELRKFAKEHGLGERVRFIFGAPATDVAALYRLAAVTVYPSLLEGFGLPVLEALASGTPVVTSRGGCFEEAGGGAAAYVDPRDPDELRSVLAELLEDGERRRRMAEAGLAHAEAFRDELIAQKIFTVYEEALAA